ncbi:MAG TPA: hypothetical protein DCW52_09240 [Gammaproteobacteria bacterium]|nr:hypothetical protein [Gammaproteobacteria bacterium]
MIEVLALAGAVTKVAGSISAAVKAGKDMNSLMPSFGKLAQLEADINLAESGKHKGPLGRLTSSEQEGFAIGQARIAHRDAMEDLRSQCRLYGSPGLWDSVVVETAAARVRHKKALEEQAEARDKLFYMITVGFVVLGAIGGSIALLWGVAQYAE